MVPRLHRPARIPPAPPVATPAPALRTEVVLLGAIATLLVLVGSLTPFQFQPRAAIGLSWLPPTREDLLVNLFVYLPAGFTLFGGLSRWLRSRTWTTLLATAGAAGLSLGLETLQTFSAARWASWTDVLLNTIGGFLGALLAPAVGQAADGLANTLRRAYRQGPLAAASLALTVGLLLQGLAPFDFVRNGAEFRASLLSSHWWPIAERYAPPNVAGTSSPYAGLLNALSLCGLFCLLGAVHALAQRARGGDRESALASGAGHAALVAVLMEVLQLFLRSCVFDTLDLCTAAVAGLAGAWLAALAYDACPWHEIQTTRPVNALSAALAIVVFCQVAWHAASGLGHAPHGGPPHSFSAPFATLLAVPFLTAVGTITSAVLRYMLLGASLATLAWAATGKVRWGRVAGVVGAVALLAAWGRTGFAPCLPDLTNACLALVAVALCATLRLAPARSALQAPA